MSYNLDNFFSDQPWGNPVPPPDQVTMMAPVYADPNDTTPPLDLPTQPYDGTSIFGCNGPDDTTILSPVTAADDWEHVYEEGDWSPTSDWSPDPATIPQGQAFTQTRNRSRTITDYWVNHADGTRRDDNTHLEYGSESQAATGTKTADAVPATQKPPVTPTSSQPAAPPQQNQSGSTQAAFHPSPLIPLPRPFQAAPVVIPQQTQSKNMWWLALIIAGIAISDSRGSRRKNLTAGG
jgi:hypothetical protein